MTEASPTKKNWSAQRAWAAENPTALWAHSATRSAIRRGILIRPDACEACGKPGRVDAHHPDHRNPLLVNWLCRSCHRLHHNAERRKGGGT